MHLMFFINFQCFFIIAVKAISRYKFWKWKKNKNTFFIFSGIQIHGRLTKKHEHFRFSRHFPPVSKQFPKSDVYLIALPSGHQKHQENKKCHFFWKFWVFFITLNKIRKPGAFLILRFFKKLTLWSVNLGKSIVQIWDLRWDIIGPHRYLSSI